MTDQTARATAPPALNAYQAGGTARQPKRLVLSPAESLDDAQASGAFIASTLALSCYE